MADARPDQLTQRLDGLKAATPADAPPLPTQVVAALRRRRRTVAAWRAGAAVGAIALAASVAMLSLRDPPAHPEPIRSNGSGLGSLAAADPLPTAAALFQHYTRGEDGPTAPLSAPSDILRAGDGLWAGPERVAELASGV